MPPPSSRGISFTNSSRSSFFFAQQLSPLPVILSEVEGSPSSSAMRGLHPSGQKMPVWVQPPHYASQSIVSAAPHAPHPRPPTAQANGHRLARASPTGRRRPKNVSRRGEALQRSRSTKKTVAGSGEGPWCSRNAVAALPMSPKRGHWLRNTHLLLPLAPKPGH